MGQPSIIASIREKIGSLAWRIFLWANQMTEEQYHATYLEHLDDTP